MSKSGKFMYRVVSTSPIQILAGPSFDAPKNKAVLLPGTIHEFSLKITLDTETEDLYFLRLSHRRGWIADRKLIQSSDHHRAYFVPVVKEISAETCKGGDSIASHSVGSSVAISSVSAVTLCSVAARMRHRPPRRQFVNGRDSITFPRHIVGGAIAKQSTPFTTLVKDRSKADKNRQDDALVMTPSSNVSMMSDDASINQELADQVMGPNLLSSNSVAPVKQSSHPPAQCRTFYLMRVTAPRGLKVLDAPQTQVNNLIYGKHHGGCLLTPLNAFSTLGDSKLSHQGRLGTAGASNNTNSAVFDSFLKTRIIRRGSYFEASRRMENTGGYDQGAGLIKLSDNSGWAIVPQFDELEAQYRLLSDAELSCADGHASTAFEEVGCAAVDDYFEIAKEYAPVQAASFKTLWVRVHARSGVQIACPPPIPPMSFEDNETASLSSHGSSVHRELKITQLCSKDTDVASSVGSSFIDAMFRTPTRKADRSVTQNQRAPPPRRPADSLTCSNVIACGLVLEVERPDEGAANQLETLYARLRGGQGWLPLSQAGKSVSTCVPPPEIRFGSFWFRVQAIGGIKVRLGPSKRAPSIKSGDGVYFRFECGEFLRASEVMTIFNEAGDPVECFAKLYRNRHVRLHKPVQRFRSLASLTVQAEWVNVFDEQELFLEECATEPRIERHKQGWRYTVLSSNGIAVRRGPRIAAAKTNVVLLQSETVAITERVRPAGERTSWLRLKDGRGWVQDVSDSGEQIMAPHTLRPRAVVQGGAPLKQKPTDKRQEIACNTIVARLFHNDGLEYKFHPNKE
ncbi:hypothetical protein MPSEU_000512700 [Mayamaea pseudoterrestris]|nr:hypothetical protein MPSEU_000512700 [Mayamaea pseudoterrestris]